jgi:hypothetical protein
VGSVIGGGSFGDVIVHCLVQTSSSGEADLFQRALSIFAITPFFIRTIKSRSARAEIGVLTDAAYEESL